MEELIQAHCLEKERTELFTQLSLTYPARAESARAVTADVALTVGWGRLFGASAVFLYENGHFSETKSRKIDPKVGINRLA